MKNIYVSIILFYCLFIVNKVNGQGKKGIGSSKQDWDYVNLREGAYYFWWLYYASPSSNWEQKPLLIAPSKGIGKSASGYINFDQIGPLDIDLNPRKNPWLDDYNILFIDNVLGSGFSYADNETYYASTNDQAADDLFKVINHFLSKLPQFRTTPTYMMAETVGTQIAAKSALIWAQAQEKNLIESNFKAVVLGAPWISLTDVANYWKTTSNKDKFNEEELEEINNQVKEINEAMEVKELSSAFISFITLVTYIQGYLKLNNMYNSSPKVTTNYSDYTEDDTELLDFMNNYVKNVLELDHEWTIKADITVINIFVDNAMESIKETLSQLLQQTDLRLIIIAGSNDLLIPSSCVESWANNLDWTHKQSFQETKPININSEISVREYKNLEYYLIEAGHLLLLDNPQDFRKIIEEMTKKK
ncbi:retinoid-inducible serine carboxypeptidase-like [Microplitis mediator]|uniref:retinoid-inducible serine carboxypeptidase-like n=1 Tax=Microplitis mediator TaxID=375433 RepID=UPI002553AA9B|nr:retinoid-inducible serine carboxypeptidase-like [Microplitis mediator]